MLDLTNRSIRVLSHLFDRKLAKPTSADVKLVDQLRDAFRKLPELVPNSSEPSENAWVENMNELRYRVLNDDPRKFLRWKVILETMFVAFARYVSVELSFLKGLPDFQDRWGAVLQESPIGHPFLYPFYRRSSGNLIHHSYHISQYELCTGNAIEKLNLIVEFGGGYGSMCRLIHNLGFSGTYVIFDLPHFSALQEFYLRSLGLPVNNFVELGDIEPGVYCVSDLDQLFRLNDAFNENSLFIATWSLSETPVHIRNSITSILGCFSSFLFAYQTQFEEMDNRRYFDEWKATLKTSINWNEYSITHLPGNYYLIGARI
jgi:hypothetical protein